MAARVGWLRCDHPARKCHHALPIKPHLKNAVAAFPIHWFRRATLGQINLLAIGCLATLRGEFQPAVCYFQADVLLGYSGQFDQHQHVVFLFVDINQRLAYVFALGAVGGTTADIAKRLDL